MVPYGARLPVVADVELQEEIPPFFRHPLDYSILVFIELDVGYRRQVVKGHVHDVLAVVHGLYGDFTRLDDAKDARFDHLLIEQCGFFDIGGRLFFGFPFLPVLPVFASDLPVLLRYLFIFLTDAVAPGIGLFGDVDGPAVVLTADQHPGTLQGPFHAVELCLRGGLDEHMPALYPFGAGSIGRGGEVQGHALVRKHPSEPGPAVETDRHLTHLVHDHLHAPLPELISGPVGGVLISIRPDEPAPETVAEDVEMLHGTVVGGADPDDLFNHGVGLALQADRNEKTEDQGDKNIMLHFGGGFSIVACDWPVNIRKNRI